MSDRAPITVEVAKVYRADRRRYFTARAAARAIARAKIMERCECDAPDASEQYPGHICYYHRPEQYGPLVDRLARFVLRSFRRASQAGSAEQP